MIYRRAIVIISLQWSSLWYYDEVLYSIAFGKRLRIIVILYIVKLFVIERGRKNKRFVLTDGIYVLRFLLRNTFVFFTVIDKIQLCRITNYIFDTIANGCIGVNGCSPTRIDLLSYKSSS